MQPGTQFHSSSEGIEAAKQNPASHSSTTASSGGCGLSAIGDDDTISSMSASLFKAREHTLSSLPLSDINTSAEMTDGARFANSNAQPAGRTVQLNQQSDGQCPSEETSVMSAHDSSSDGNIQSRSWKYKFRKAARGWWLWEIGGAALSIGCMIAILSILPWIHNQPLKNWHFMVSPNTMISTLITVSKTSMLLAVAAGMGQLKWQHFHRDARPIQELDIYDEASRGPWGAFTFIFISPFLWRDIVAILGAFVMLSSLTMEPLAQQLLSFQTRHVIQKNSSAWISTVTSYGEEWDDYPESLEFRAHSLVLQGLLGSPPSFSYACPSSNCSWPDIHTLGLCSSCANVTSSYLKTTDSWYYENFSWRINYTTPKGLTLPLIIEELDDGMGTVMSGNATQSGINNLTDIAFVAIANASVLQTDYTFDIQPDIYECNIIWCAKFYSNLKMTNGIWEQYTVEEKAFSEEIYEPDDYFSQRLEECQSSLNYRNVFRITHRGKAYEFSVGCAKMSAVGRYFMDLFQFRVSDRDAPLASGQLMINTDSAPAAMSIITNAFSVYLMTSTPNTTRHYGEAFHPEIFVVIRWQWRTGGYEVSCNAFQSKYSREF